MFAGRDVFVFLSEARPRARPRRGETPILVAIGATRPAENRGRSAIDVVRLVVRPRALELMLLIGFFRPAPAGLPPYVAFGDGATRLKTRAQKIAQQGVCALRPKKMLDGELVAWEDGLPSFPRDCASGCCKASATSRLRSTCF